MVFIYGIVKKEKWIKDILNKKIICLSLLGLLIPMIPMIFYDVHHGYPQTVKFAVWIGYKIEQYLAIPRFILTPRVRLI